MLLEADITSVELFVENKYYRWYLLIISLEDNGEYTERHHIIPRCMGGMDNDDNLISLSYRKHFIAHWLLTKFVVKAYHNKMLWAFTSMIRGIDRRCITSWQYDIVKRVRKGCSFSEEHRRNISKGLIGRIPSEETRALWSRQRKGVSNGPMTDDQKGKISVTLSGRKRGIWINNGSISTIVPSGEIPMGWILGRLTKGRPAWNKGKPSPLRGKKIGPMSDEARANMSAAASTPEARARSSRIHKNKTLSEDTRSKISISLTGRSAGRWITDGHQNAKIKGDELLPDGWRYGATQNRKRK